MTLAEERKRDEKQRKKSRRRTLQAVADAVRNKDGIERLRAISDEAWEEAMMQSQEGEGA